MEFTYNFSNNSSDNKNILEVLHDNKPILKAEYETIGIYDPKCGIWVWAWNNSLIERSLTVGSKRVKKFAGYIKNNLKKFDIKEAEELFYYSFRGNFYITVEYIMKLIQLEMYLNNGIWFMAKKDDTRIEYFLIKKIIQVF